MKLQRKRSHKLSRIALTFGIFIFLSACTGSKDQPSTPTLAVPQSSPTPTPPMGKESIDYSRHLLAAGGDDACVVDNEGVKCWGYERLGNQLGKFKNIRQIVMGSGNFCVLDNNDVSCFMGKLPSGFDPDFTLNPPKEIINKEVQQIYARGYRVCAIVKEKNADVSTSTGICWGTWGDWFAPSKVDNFVAGDNYVCSIEKNQVHCHCSNFASPECKKDPDTYKQVKNPKKLVSGRNHVCVLDDQGVTCWGSNEYHQIDVPILKNPRELVTGDFHTCAIDEDGVKCWGSNDKGQTAVPQLNGELISLAAGYAKTCALTISNVVCWGHYFGTDHGTQVPVLYLGANQPPAPQPPVPTPITLQDGVYHSNSGSSNLHLCDLKVVTTYDVLVLKSVELSKLTPCTSNPITLPCSGAVCRTNDQNPFELTINSGTDFKLKTPDLSGPFDYYKVSQ